MLTENHVHTDVQLERDQRNTNLQGASRWVSVALRMINIVRIVRFLGLYTVKSFNINSRCTENCRQDDQLHRSLW